LLSSGGFALAALAQRGRCTSINSSGAPKFRGPDCKVETPATGRHCDEAPDPGLRRSRIARNWRALMSPIVSPPWNPRPREPEDGRGPILSWLGRCSPRRCTGRRDPPCPPLSGDELAAELGNGPGPPVGELLEEFASRRLRRRYRRSRGRAGTGAPPAERERPGAGPGLPIPALRLPSLG
jgi:hypothetical protein